MSTPSEQAEIVVNGKTVGYGLDGMLAAFDEMFGPRCDGSLTCEAWRHRHGCFADRGNCDEPEEHTG